MTVGLPLAYGTTFGKAVPHWAMRSVTWGQFCRLLQKPAGAKTEAMSYLLGTITPGPGVKCKCAVYLHRTKANVANRSAITLDADYCGNAGFTLLENLDRLSVQAAVHTTWSSTADDQRYRVIVPTSRLVEPLEYGPLARLLMKALGGGFFDHTCDQASRLMYLPSAPDLRHYWLSVREGERLDVDMWLDLAGGPDVILPREPVEVQTKSFTPRQRRQLVGLANTVAGCEEGNRDSLLLWALKCVLDDGMDPEIAGPVLVAAGVHSGLEEDICWEKVARVLG